MSPISGYAGQLRAFWRVFSKAYCRDLTIPIAAPLKCIMPITVNLLNQMNLKFLELFLLMVIFDDGTHLNSGSF